MKLEIYNRKKTENYDYVEIKQHIPEQLMGQKNQNGNQKNRFR